MAGMIQTPGGMRIVPSLPEHAVKSYQMISPGRPATCEETGCQQYLNGWKTIVPEDMAPQVRALRDRYSFTEQRQDGGLAEFTFPAGQQCFLGRAGKHRLPAEGRERFRVVGGDWRGNPRGDVREHVRAADWVEDFAEHQQRLADRLERG